MTAFAGVRVLDFATQAPGSLAAMLLADFGADVVKLTPPSPRDPPDAAMWGRNKRLYALDLDAAAGAAEAERLLARADVAVFDLSPRTLAQSPFAPDSVLARHPAVIHAWLPPYGHAGEESELPPSHLLLSAISAVAFRQGSFADQPVHLIAPLLHYGQGVLGAATIAAALIARARDGRGRRLRVSGLDAVAQMNGSTRDVGASAMATARPTGGAPNYRVYECADGVWIFLGSLFEPFISNAREVLGLPPRGEDMTPDEPLYIAAFKTRSRADWLDALRAAGVPSAPVRDNESWFESEPVAANKMAVRIHDEARGLVAMPGICADLSETPGAVRAALTRSEAPDWSASPARAATDSAAALLDGVRVLDMGVVIAGASTGAILASLGADVIKVEGAEGDPFRSSGLVSAAFNRGKRALAVDLKSEDGRGVFHRLAERADVVLDNFRLGVRTRLGIDYPALRARNPRIVSCSITAYGRIGERAPWPGFDPLVQAESGLMQRQGGAGQAPVYHQIAVNDVASAAVCAFSILAALYARLRTGAGQEVVTALARQGVFYQAHAFTRYDGAPPPDDGDRDCLGVTALRRFYPCRDGWIGIDCVTPSAAAALAQVLKLEDFPADPAHALAAPRKGALSECLAAAFAARDAEPTARALRQAGAPAARARRADDTYQDAFLAENSYFERYDHADFGRVFGVTAYGASDGAAHGFTRPAPRIGEHTGELLAEAGYSEAEIAALYAARAVF